MRINDRNLTGAAADTSRAAETNQAEKSRALTGASPASGDRVEFSGGLSALSRAVSADHAARANRIQALASQVAAGTYQPDSQAISRGLVSEALAH